MASSLSHRLTLYLLLCVCLSKSSFTEETSLFVSARVGGVVTFQCNPRHVHQDGVYVHKFLHTSQKVSYFYHDGSFTPMDPYEGRLASNKNLSSFILSIHNLTVRDSGVYWCTFNNEDIDSVSKERYLLVVSGKATQCPDGEGNSFQTLIIVCVLTASSMVLLIFILLWVISKIKRCCERGNYTPTQQSSDSGSTKVQQSPEYEVMRSHPPLESHTLINPAYESTTKHTTMHRSY